MSGDKDNEWRLKRFDSSVIFDAGDIPRKLGRENNLNLTYKLVKARNQPIIDMIDCCCIACEHLIAAARTNTPLQTIHDRARELDQSDNRKLNSCFNFMKNFLHSPEYSKRIPFLMSNMKRPIKRITPWPPTVIVSSFEPSLGQQFITNPRASLSTSSELLQQDTPVSELKRKSNKKHKKKKPKKRRTGDKGSIGGKKKEVCKFKGELVLVFLTIEPNVV